MAATPTVVVAMHDGFYGAGTGAGYANRGFLTTLIDMLAPGVRLVVMPIFLADTSAEYQAGWHGESVVLCERAGATVLPVDNGTHGQTRFGSVDAFARAASSAAALLASEVLPTASDIAVVLFDVPFLDLPRHLSPQLVPRLAMVPRSTGLLHDPGNHARVTFERDGLRFLAAGGGRVAPISGYMRAHLEDDYALPASALLDLPDGLTADEWYFRPPAAPVLPPAAEAGFLLAYGRAQPYKGWDDLIGALALLRGDGVRLPHAVLAAVTDQPTTSDYQRHLADRVQALRLDATLVTRFDPSIRGLLAHRALRAVVVPSRTEPFGRVPLEAYAAGAAPVVVTAAGGLAEQVIDGITGFIAAPADPTSLAGAIRLAVGVSDVERGEMRARALDLAHERFDHRDAVRTFFGEFAPFVCADSPAPDAGAGLSRAL